MEETELPEYFGDWLKLRRNELDLTQAELALRAGCSVPALRKIESGDRRPSKQLAGLLAKSLEIPSEDQATFIRVARGESNIERLPPPTYATPGANKATIKTSRSPGNLPSMLNPFIGRELELTALGQLLCDPRCRLLTLTGPGGIGKTRLALLLFAWRAWTARPRPSRTLLLAAGLAAALLSPSLLKSYLASGWPLYPVPFGPFDPDWKLPSETVHRTFDWIRRAGAVEALGGAGPEAIAEARRHSAGDLLLLWLRRQLRNAGPLYAVLAPAGALVLMLAFSRRARRDAAGHRVVVLLASLSFLGWLLGAPLFRYGFGYVGVLFAALASCLLRPGLVSGGVRRPIRVLGLATGVALVARMCHIAVAAEDPCRGFEHFFRDYTAHQRCRAGNVIRREQKAISWP